MSQICEWCEENEALAWVGQHRVCLPCYLGELWAIRFPTEAIQPSHFVPDPR